MAGGVVLLLLTVGVGTVALVAWYVVPGFVADLGTWPEPQPVGGTFRPDEMVTLHVSGVVDDNTRDAIQDKMASLADPGESYLAHAVYSSDRMTIVVAPVRDPAALVARIDFGTVRRVNGRVITVAARTADGPPPNADGVTRALSGLKSDNMMRRHQSLRYLKDPLPDDRRAEVAAALEPLLNDRDHFVRDDAIEALGVWGGRDNVPALLKAMNDKDTRRAAIQALGRLKDERAVEPLAGRLEDFFDSHDAAEALKAIGPAAEKAVLKLLNHHDSHVRSQACQILQVIGAAESLPALRKVVAENDFFLTHEAERAIEVITARQ